MANESEIIIDGSISPQNRDGESTFSGNITLPEGITDVKSQKEDNKNNAEFIETLTDSMKKVLYEVLDSLGLSYNKPESKTEAKEEKKDQTKSEIPFSGTKRTEFTNPSEKSINMLKKLPLEKGLGFALLYNKLDEFKEIFKGKESKNSKESVNSKGLSGVLNSLKDAGQIVTSLAAGFLMFEAAMALSQAVDIDFGKGLKIFALFETFILVNTAMMRLLKGVDGGALKEFANSIKSLTICFGLFGAALLITSLIPESSLSKGKSVLFQFKVFVFEMAALASLLNKMNSDLKKFSISIILMTSSILLFSASIYAAGKVFNYIPKALATLGLFTLFVAGFVALGALIGSAAPFFLMFTAGTVLMSTSILLFSLSLKVAGSIKNEVFVKAFGVLGTMTSFLISFTLIGPIAILAAGASVPILIATSVTMAVFLEITVILGEVKLINKLMEKVNLKENKIFGNLSVLFLEMLGFSLIANLTAAASLPLAKNLIAVVIAMGEIVLIVKALQYAINVTNKLDKDNITHFFNVITGAIAGLIPLSIIAIPASIASAILIAELLLILPVFVIIEKIVTSIERTAKIVENLPETSTVFDPVSNSLKKIATTDFSTSSLILKSFELIFTYKAMKRVAKYLNKIINSFNVANTSINNVNKISSMFVNLSDIIKTINSLEKVTENGVESISSLNTAIKAIPTDIKKEVKSMNALSSAFTRLNLSINTLNTGKLEAFRGISDYMINATNSVNRFIEAINELNKIEVNDKIGNMAKDITSGKTQVGSIRTLSPEVQANINNGKASPITINSNKSIEDILKEWGQKGVPVKVIKNEKQLQSYFSN